MLEGLGRRNLEVSGLGGDPKSPKDWVGGPDCNWPYMEC